MATPPSKNSVLWDCSNLSGRQMLDKKMLTGVLVLFQAPLQSSTPLSQCPHLQEPSPPNRAGERLFSCHSPLLSWALKCGLLQPTFFCNVTFLDCVFVCTCVCVRESWGGRGLSETGIPADLPSYLLQSPQVWSWSPPFSLSLVPIPPFPFLPASVSILCSSPYWGFLLRFFLLKMSLISIPARFDCSIMKSDFLLQTCLLGSVTNNKVLPSSGSPQNVPVGQKVHKSLSAMVLGLEGNEY